jgi:hypothetical protein
MRPSKVKFHSAFRVSRPTKYYSVIFSEPITKESDIETAVELKSTYKSSVYRPLITHVLDSWQLNVLAMPSLLHAAHFDVPNHLKNDS